MLAAFLQLIDDTETRSDFEKFYYQYRKLLYYVAYDIVKDAHLAEDVLSETFMNLARNFDFIRSLGGNIMCRQIKRYAVVSVKHTAINLMKKEKRGSDISFEDSELEWSTDDPNSFDQIIEKEQIERVNRVLEELPQIYKEVMQLYVVCENNVDEVAKALDLTKQTVYKRIQRARKMIEKALEE